MKPQLTIRQTVFYCLFVNQNPSFKQYVITGHRESYYSYQQAVAFMGRIAGQRATFQLPGRVLAELCIKNYCPN